MPVRRNIPGRLVLHQLWDVYPLRMGFTDECNVELVRMLSKAIGASHASGTRTHDEDSLPVSIRGQLGLR